MVSKAAVDLAPAGRKKPEEGGSMEPRGENDVRTFFEKAGVRKEIRSFPESTHNSELAAQSLGVLVGQIAKTILLLVDEEPLVVVISGDRRVDFKKVKTLRGGRRVRLAGPEDVAARTGYKVGAVPPVALPPGIPVFLDASLRRFASIYPAAGETNNMFATTPDELLGLTEGRESDLAREESRENGGFSRLVLLPLLAVLIFVLYTWFTLTWTYGSGERAGYVQKLSKKGWICKTWEGELAMVSIPGTMPEKFLFTVREDSVAARINASLGKRVVLFYRQHKGIPTSCFGETEYFVGDVKIIE
jgi:prolyl-tRNA editing enzyme YbaK/EbsC (Cys-tRNA(Pro) deacylase)